MTDYLHTHPNFNDLILILSNELSVSPVLIVKDYWIMHCLYGLQSQGLNFQMKGGTSLSKGYNLIQRFSEDIDILIEPPKEISVHIGRNQNKDVHRDSRRNFYDWLAQNIKIHGIVKSERDTAHLMTISIEAAESGFIIKRRTTIQKILKMGFF
jgi:predicted nucleotidyltransferase component of viral defense system